MRKTYEKFGEKLYEYIKQAGLKQTYLKENYGFARSNISRWCSGYGRPGDRKQVIQFIEIFKDFKKLNFGEEQANELLVLSGYDQLEETEVTKIFPPEGVLPHDTTTTIDSNIDHKQTEALQRSTAEGVRRIEDTMLDVHQGVRILVRRGEQSEDEEKSSKYNTELALSSIFVIKTGREVTATDLLQIRAQSKKGYRPDIYFSRSRVDGEIVKQVSNLNNVIITGKPLAGKSRAMLHLVNEKFPDAYIFFPQENFSLERINELTFDFSQWRSTPRIFLFNDIDRFVDDPDDQHQSPFIRLLYKIFEEEKNIIVASCRTIKSAYVNHALGELSGHFNTISIPPLTDQQRKDVESVTEKNKNLQIDDTVGSYFFPTSEMKIIYDDIFYRLDEKNEENLRIQFEILRSYKCVELWQKDIAGNQPLVKGYVEKRLVNRYGENLEQPLAPFIWDRELRVVEKLGFVEIKEGDLYIDPVYTENFIATEYDDETSLASEIVEYYPDTETYTRLINRVNSSQLSQHLFKQMLELAIDPDVITYNVLMVRSQDLAKAEEFYVQMRERDIAPNGFTLNVILTKAPTLDISWEIVDRMKEFDVQPDYITVNILLNKASDLTGAQSIIERLGVEYADFDIITFNLLMRKTDTYAHANEIFANILQSGLEPSEVTFATLMGKAQTFAQGLEIFSHMKEAKLQPNEAFINSIIRKKGGTFEETWEICEYGLDKNYLLDQWSFRRIVDRAEDFSQAMRIYNKLVELGLTPSPTVFTRLVKHALDYQEALKIYKLMTDVGTKPTKFFYNTLMRKAPSFAEAWRIYELMENDEIGPDPNTFSNLVKLSDTLEHAKEIFELFIEKGIEPILAVFHELISKSTRFKQAWANYELILEHNLDPLPRTFNLLVQKATTFEDALKVLSLLNIHAFLNSPPYELRYILHVVLRKAKQLSDVERALDAMDEFVIIPSERTIVLFLEAIGTHRAPELVDRLKGKLEKQPLANPKLQIQNLDRAVDSEELEELFSLHGEVKRALVKPKRKLGIVEMQTIEEAETAREKLDFSEFWGLNIKVSEEKPIGGNRR